MSSVSTTPIDSRIVFERTMRAHRNVLYMLVIAVVAVLMICIYYTSYVAGWKDHDVAILCIALFYVLTLTVVAPHVVYVHSYRQRYFNTHNRRSIDAGAAQ